MVIINWPHQKQLSNSLPKALVPTTIKTTSCLFIDYHDKYKMAIHRQRPQNKVFSGKKSSEPSRFNSKLPRKQDSSCSTPHQRSLSGSIPLVDLLSSNFQSWESDHMSLHRSVAPDRSFTVTKTSHSIFPRRRKCQRRNAMQLSTVREILCRAERTLKVSESSELLERLIALTIQK